MAVLTVLLFHTGPFLIPSVAPKLLPGGFLGVDIFFVLSGFLMTNILLEPKQSYGRFYVRRVARIFPALYVFLAAQFLYSVRVGGGVASDLRAYPLIALGIGNWGSSLGIALPFGVGQTWSLGVEEQLYLLWPLVLVLIGRRDPHRLRYLCLAGIGLSLVAKVAMFHAGVPAPDIYAQTEGRLDDFLVGALVATTWRTGRRPVRHLRPLTVAAGVFLALALAYSQPFASAWLYEGGFTAVAVSTGVILYACLHQTPETGFAAWRPLRALGRYSYSIYLWHPLVFLAVSHFVPHDTPVRVLCAAGILAGATVASTRLVEEPLRRLAARATTRPKTDVPALVLAGTG